ncbi:MAG TPA: hypothetical protein VGR27_11045 [Longimicrobiaceae bacterium]|nr:hypothetical protein [Longimicrobiaceae bacterium]
MADIDVQRERSAPWLWIILGLVVLALAIWAIAAALDTDEDEMAAVPVTTIEAAIVDEPVTPAPAEMYAPEVRRSVEEYIGWAVPPTPGEMGPDHRYTAEGIRRLAAALSAIERAEPTSEGELQAEFAEFRQVAERLVQSANRAQTHADWVHQTFSRTVELMEQLRQARFAESADLRNEITALREVARTVSPQKNLLDQKDEVKSFFMQATRPLALLARMTPPDLPTLPLEVVETE